MNTGLKLVDTRRKGVDVSVSLIDPTAKVLVKSENRYSAYIWIGVFELDSRDLRTISCSPDRAQIVGTDPKLRTERDWTHPFFWAPFILIGNWK